MHRDTRKLQARLRLAFKSLRARGYIALDRPACCASCSWARIMELAAGLLESGKRERIAGAVFYHDQDADHMREEGECYIGYGPLIDPVQWDATRELREAVLIGRDVVKVLQAHRLAVEWDGSPKTRIRATIPPAEQPRKMVSGTSG